MKNIIIGVMLTLFSFSSFAEELDVSISGSDIATLISGVRFDFQ